MGAEGRRSREWVVRAKEVRARNNYFRALDQAAPEAAVNRVGELTKVHHPDGDANVKNDLKRTDGHAEGKSSKTLCVIRRTQG